MLRIDNLHIIENPPTLSNESQKSPIEKRKRNLKKYSPISRRGRERDFISQGSRGKREFFKMILHFREEKEKWILIYRDSRGEREIQNTNFANMK